MNRDDDTWSHQVELGWVRMTNLLPNTPYKVVISFFSASNHLTACLFLHKLVSINHLNLLVLIFCILIWAEE